MSKQKLHVVSFSGGKDSTAMLLRMIDDGYPVDVVLYCDTGIEFPEMYEHIDKVEKYIDRDITRLKADRDYMYYATKHNRVIKSDKIQNLNQGEIVKGYGYPTVFSRWCTKALKVDIIKKHMTKLRREYDVIEYVGIALDESRRVRDKVYPLVDWKMTEADCLKYCYDRGFTWGGLYEIWGRVSCWCCPLQSLDDLRKLREHRPELWSKLRDMDNAISKTDRPNFHITKSLSDIACRFEVEDEFIAQGKKLRTKEFFQALKDRGIKY